jgi:hypothetical protein
MMPVHVAGLVALAWAWRNRSSQNSATLGAVLCAAAASSACAGMVLFCWAGACSRYITELSAGWTVATAIGMAAVLGTHDARGRATRILTTGAACWTIACVWLASAEFRGFMRQTNPRTYATVAHALDYPSQWWARRQGIEFGPVDVVVRIPHAGPGAQTVLVASGRPQRVNQLLVGGLDAGHVSLILAENQHQVLSTPGLSAPGGRLRIRLDAPWLYPPAEHPYWDAITDPATRLDRQTLFSIEWESGGTRVHSTHSVDPTAFEPAVQGPSRMDPDSPFVESIAPAAPKP